MDSELGRLGASLSLTEEEEAGLVPMGLWHSEPLTRGFFIVGRLVSSKSFHPEALHTTLRSVFNPVRGMDFKLIEGERFLLKFFHILDRNRVLERCPWAYEKNLLVLSPVEAIDDPITIELNWCDFHIHIHGLPLGKMTRDVAAFIGNKLGKFKEVDLDSNGEVWGSSVRIRVSIDITKPLKCALKLRTVLGDEQLVTFTYERLPNFCYLCGVLGHLSRQCETQLHDGFCDPGENAPYGNWLRAATPSSYRGRIGVNGTRSSSGFIRRPSFVSSSSLQSQSVPPPPLAEVVVADLNLVPPPPTINLPLSPVPSPPSRDTPPPDLVVPPSSTITHSLPTSQNLSLHQPSPTLASLPDIPLPRPQLKKANIRPRSSSKIAHSDPKPVLAQKRHLVGDLSDDESVSQGPSKLCRLSIPLLDVTNLEAATAGQSRRSS
ncbi:UNVERIFIED_CONTAM: hypothetical protein Slati_2578900 [Sesamum latifolium]|uniref:CCHC-type domain-containing protein n=1 Tax=Sesamum latifolium TaxID=2727402 RepID=A0AAW2VX33_9LAMI